MALLLHNLIILFILCLAIVNSNGENDVEQRQQVRQQTKKRLVDIMNYWKYEIPMLITNVMEVIAIQLDDYERAMVAEYNQQFQYPKATTTEAPPTQKTLSTVSTDICQAPVETGPCRAAKRRFYYNPLTGRCEQFLYGGCQGNDNNFFNMETCEKACVKQGFS